MSESLAERIERYRAPLEGELRAAVGDDPQGLFAWMRYHLGWEDERGAGAAVPAGKLLRPTAVLLAAELTGGTLERALPAAAAVELIHNFSLLHDDVEDRSDRRRGRPALWTFAGQAQAINTGDGMFTIARLAMYRLLDVGVPQPAVLQAMRELDEACLRLVRGQYLDISFEQRSDVGRAEYIAMAEGKTAAMFAAPFAIGAIVAGAAAPVIEALRRFGRHTGLAFQAVDDVLGIWGDSAVTGKPAGEDLATRKMTYPVIAAIEAGGEDSARFARAYAAPASESDDIAELARLIEATGARAATEEMARAEQRAAIEALDAAGLDEQARTCLDQYVAAAVGRVS